MRKKFGVALCLCLATGLISCQNTKESQTTTAESSTEEKREKPTFDYSKGLEDTGYMTDLSAADYVELPEYKGVKKP